MPGAIGPDGLGVAERRLLLTLLRPSVETQPALRADAGDWVRLAEAIPWGLAPYVYWSATRVAASAAIPKEPLEQLRAVTGRLALTRLRQQAAFRSVCVGLREANVPHLVLKGAALAHLVYPDPGLRPMSDVDLWVPADRLEQATAILMAQGLEYPERVRLGAPVGSPPDRASSRTLEPPGGGVTIELHGSVPSLHGVSWGTFDAAWRSAVPATLHHIPAHILCPFHFLTHVGLHAARRERFRTGLLPLLDIALLADHWTREWDWDGMAAAWNRERVGPWMLLCLTLARDLLAAPIPHDLERRCGVPVGWTEMRQLAEEQLWDGPRYRFLLDPMRVRANRGLLGWMRQRIVDYYWHSPQPRPVAEVVRDAFRRARFDLTVKLPRHVRGWRSGVVDLGSLRRGAALAHARRQLEQLVLGAGGLGSPDSEP